MIHRSVSLFLALALLLISTPVPVRAESLSLKVANITMVPVPPTCEVRSTKRVIRSGGHVDIVWKSRGAAKMVGMVQGDTEWPADGRQRIALSVRGKHVFPLTFVGKNGATRTCSATVFVHAKR